jgi:diguanylate cyclase (GGDEF)-like protein/PAS domain S-box-containing protein
MRTAPRFTSVFDSLLDHSKAAILEIDSDMAVITRNETAKSLMSRLFANNEFSTKSCLNWIFQDEFGTVLRSTDRPIDLTMKTGRQITRQIVGIARADGSPVWLRLSTRLVHEGQNNSPRVIAVLSEVSVDAASTNALQSAAVVTAIMKSLAVAEFNMDGTIVWANEQFLSPLGYSLSEVQGRHHRTFVDPLERKSPDYSRFWQDLNWGEHRIAEYKRLGKNGREVWIRGSYTPILGADGAPVKVIKLVTDVTLQKLEAANYAGQIAAIDKAMGVVEFDLTGTVIAANDKFLTMLGYTLEEVLGKHHRMFVEPSEEQNAGYQDFWSSLRGDEYRVAEYQRVGKNGREVWLQATYNPILDLNGRPYKIVKFAIDITERKRLEADLDQKIKLLRQLSITDGLTGLFNRRHIDEVIRMEIARARRCKAPLTIALFDIDHFKRINDQLGHACGDDVLKATALALKIALRETDIIARYGGEEFLAVLPLTTLHEAVSALSRVKIIIATHVTPGLPHPVTVSAGVARYRDGETPVDFVNRADKLLYEAKREGRDRFAFSEDIETE